MKLAVAGSDVLDQVMSFIGRFVAVSEVQRPVLALWVAHTHAFEIAETTPYLNVTSAEKQCGKTRLLEVLSLLVAKPWLTGSVSKAVLVRKLDIVQPTLLLDETDAAFAGDKEYSEALRAVLNNGHSREGVASLCVGQGSNITFKDFRVFSPKAIAGIGKLPDTVADRSIPIRMKRRIPTQKSERFRRRHCKGESDEISNRLINWINEHLQILANATPELPILLSDRQQDGCEPLLAIADAAGGDWPEKSRHALVELLTGEAAEDSSLGVRLLSDIRTVFEQKGVERLSTTDLLSGLYDEEPQWAESVRGRPLSAATLARLLKAFDIHHTKLRFGDATPWGYERESFTDAWIRYLPSRMEQVEHSRYGTLNTHVDNLEQISDVPPQGNEDPSIPTGHVPDVPPRGVAIGREGHPCYIHGMNTDWWERPPRGSGEFVCNRCHPEPRTLTAREIGF